MMSQANSTSLFSTTLLSTAYRCCEPATVSWPTFLISHPFSIPQHFAFLFLPQEMIASVIM